MKKSYEQLERENKRMREVLEEIISENVTDYHHFTIYSATLGNVRKIAKDLLVAIDAEADRLNNEAQS